MSNEKALYVLELKTQVSAETKWYVGITGDPEQRLTHHKSESAVEWVRQHRLVEQYNLGWGQRKTIRTLENQLTKALMAEYGVDSTRGGDYTKPDLLPSPDVQDVGIPVYLGKALQDVDNQQLAAISKYTVVRARILDDLEFDDFDTALEWIDDSLPQGTEVELSQPLETAGTVTAGGVDEAD